MRKVLLIPNKTHNFTVLINIFLIFVCWWFKFKHFIKYDTLKAFVWTGCRNFHLFVSDFVVPVDIQFNRLIRLSIVALITGWASKYSIITSISIIPFLQIIMWMSVSVHSFSDKCEDFFLNLPVIFHIFGYHIEKITTFGQIWIRNAMIVLVWIQRNVCERISVYHFNYLDWSNSIQRLICHIINDSCACTKRINPMI